MLQRRRLLRLFEPEEIELVENGWSRSDPAAVFS